MSHLDTELRAVLESRNGTLTMNILNVAAFFAPEENIRISTFSPIAPDFSDLHDAIRFLDRRGLVKCSDESFFRISSSTGAELRDRLKSVSLKEAILERALLLLNKTKYDESPHLMAVYLHVKTRPSLYHKLEILPGHIIFGMNRSKSFQEAIDFATECLELLTEPLGGTHRTILGVKRYLVFALESLGKKQEAVGMMLDVYEKLCLLTGESDTYCALVDLATIVFNDNLLPTQSEKEIYLRKIVFKEKSFTENLDDCGQVKKCFQYVRLLLFQFGLTGVAFGLLEDFIHVRKSVSGVIFDDYVYDAMQTIGQCLTLEGEFHEALCIFRDVYVQKVVLYGASHEMSLHLRHDMGKALMLWGNLDKALFTFEKLERDAKIALPETHGINIATKKFIVKTHMLKRNYEKALELNTEFYEELVKAFGWIHPCCFDCKLISGEILSLMNKPQEALKVYQDLLEKYECTYFPLVAIEKLRSEILETRGKCKYFHAPSGTLHSFVKEGNLNKVPSLISTGDLDAKDSRGMTPLHYASASGKVEVARVLIEKGAEFNSKAPSTPLQLAKGSEVTSLLQTVHSFFEAARAGCMESLIELYYKEPCALNAKDDQHCTPLHLAAMNGHSDVIKVLLDLRADPADKGNSPLHVAASKGHERVAGVFADILGRNGLDDKTKGGGNTPLHAAAEKGHLGVVRVLLARGADCTARNSAGKTPAVQSGEHPECGKLLRLIEGLFQEVEKENVDVEAVCEKLRGLGEDDVPAVAWARNGSYQTLLQVAMKHKHIQLVHKLGKLLRIN